MSFFGCDADVMVGPVCRRNFPLKMLNVGRATALEFSVGGVPAEVASLQFHVGRPGNDTFSVVVASRRRNGVWNVYASGLYFPEVGTVNYHLTGRDGKGNAVWLGGGVVNVLQSAINTSETDVPVVPDDTYVRNPATGLWHKLSIAFEDGGFLPIISNEGITR